MHDTNDTLTAQCGGMLIAHHGPDKSGTLLYMSCSKLGIHRPKKYRTSPPYVPPRSVATAAIPLLFGTALHCKAYRQKQASVNTLSLITQCASPSTRDFIESSLLAVTGRTLQMGCLDVMSRNSRGITPGEHEDQDEHRQGHEAEGACAEAEGHGMAQRPRPPVQSCPQHCLTQHHKREFCLHRCLACKACSRCHTSAAIYVQSVNA